jgi:adenosine 3'-phospho 5'-phosphosulfate transporter B3
MAAAARFICLRSQTFAASLLTDLLLAPLWLLLLLLLLHLQWCKIGTVLWGAAGGGLRAPAAPQKWHFAIGLLGFATMWLSNESLLFLNYPTQTLFKSAKLLPVMFASVLINRTRFLAMEYLSALGLLAGLVAFTLTDARVSPSFDMLGVALICLALIADALIGNLQEKMFRQFQCSGAEMMSWSALYSSAFALATCVAEGEVVRGTTFLLSSPLAAVSLAIYALFNILGIYFVLAMIAHFGATLTTFTTSLRKALTLMLSFLIYPKPFAMGYGTHGHSGAHRMCRLCRSVSHWRFLLCSLFPLLFFAAMLLASLPPLSLRRRSACLRLRVPCPGQDVRPQTRTSLRHRYRRKRAAGSACVSASRLPVLPLPGPGNKQHCVSGTVSDGTQWGQA